MFRNSQLPPLRLWIHFPFSLALPPERRNHAKRLPKSLKNIGRRICDWRNLWPTDVSLWETEIIPPGAQCKDLSETVGKIMVHGTCNSAVKLNKPTERRKANTKSQTAETPFLCLKLQSLAPNSSLFLRIVQLIQFCVILIMERRYKKNRTCEQQMNFSTVKKPSCLT